MHKIKLVDNLEISRIVHGHWRLADWQLSNQELRPLQGKFLKKEQIIPSTYCYSYN